MTLRYREFIKLIQIFSVNRVNRDKQHRTFVKLSFSKQQKLKQICFYPVTWRQILLHQKHFQERALYEL